MYHIYVFAFGLNRLIVYKIYLTVYKLGLTFVICVMTVYMIYKCRVGTIGWRQSWIGYLRNGDTTGILDVDTFVNSYFC